MTLVGELPGLPRFDYTDPSVRGVAFHEAILALRAQGWLAQGPYGYIVLDRHAGEQFLRTRSASFPGKALIELFAVSAGPLREEMERNILHLNGPDHARLRSLLNPSLSPRAVQRHRPALQALLADLYAGIVAESHDADATGIRCEAVSALTMPYPAQAIAHVLGAPIADAPKLNNWSQSIQRQFDAESMMQRRDEIEASVAELYDYLAALLRARRERPGDDLISTLLAAEADGQRLSEVECVNLVLNVLIGGVDTTQSQLAHALRLFAEHPQQWQLLASRPELAGDAVEEVLRFEPVTPFTARIVEADVELRGVTFPAGTIVMVCAFTGNRDDDATPDDDGLTASDATAASDSAPASDATAEDGGIPRSDAGAGAFDIAANRPRARNLTFGAGVHYCVGANLARAELEEALRFLAPRMRNLQLDGEPVYGSITGIYGLTALPVRFDPAP